MAYIPAGTFVRAAESLTKRSPIQRVRLTQPFLVGVYPVTVAEYARFVAKGRTARNTRWRSRRSRRGQTTLSST